jgi:uncharacterized protein (TIRG00374 family)
LRLKGTLKILLPILISALLVVWVLHQIEDPEEVWENMRRAALLPLILIVPISLASHLVRAWRWRRFIGEPVSLFYSFTSVMIGNAVNGVLPRGGEVARLLNMSRITKIPIAHLVTTLLAERLLDVIALGALLGLAYSIEGDRIASQFPALLGPMVLLFPSIGLATVFAIAFAPEFLCTFFGGLARCIHPRLAEKVEDLIRQGARGLAFLKRPSQALPVFIETTLMWILYWIAFLLGLQAFGILRGIGYDGGMVSFSITTAGVLVPTMGAIGAYHEFGRQSLTTLYEVGSDQAVACIAIIHVILFYFVGVVCGALAWGWQAWVRRKMPRNSRK